MRYSILSLFGILLIELSCIAQNQPDSLITPIDTTKNSTQEATLQEPTYTSQLFKAFTGGINAIYNNSQTKESFDLAVQTYHYFLITGRRSKSDSVHNLRVKANKTVKELYNGIHFSLLNRAAIDFDTLKSIANSYITSLQASPITLRINKEFFITEQHDISPTSYTPVLSLVVLSDGRAIPYGDIENKVSMGVSGHLYLTFSALFKRIEFNSAGKEIDKGTMYFRPSFGIAYGNKEMMRSLSYSRKNEPIFSSQCKLGFYSDQQKVKDFSFLFQYTITKIKGPRIRAGIILRSFG